jgi:aerobic C4-dicarboxylate transport protein
MGSWVGEFDSDQAKRVLSGEDPFDEATMIDDEEPPELAEHPLAGHQTAQPVSKVRPTSV